MRRHYHQEESEGVVELLGTGFAGFKGRDDLEAAGGEDDAESDPETTV